MSFLPESCHPITLTAPLEDFPIGNLPLRLHHERLVAIDDGIEIHPHAWIGDSDFDLLAKGSIDGLADPEGNLLAWKAGRNPGAATVQGKHSFLIRYPWDLLGAHEAFMDSLQEPDIQGQVHPSAAVDGILRLGEGSTVLAGVVIEGTVCIGSQCRIGPNCYLRGPTSIGSHCHIGHAVEIKSSVILDHSSIAHLSYVGDSLIGRNVNLGAGTIISNFRHDGSDHRSMVGGKLVSTGRRKFGAVIGDGVHTGINTSIYCGRKLWSGSSTRPGEIVRDDLVL